MNEKVLVTINGAQYNYNKVDTEMQTIQQGVYKYISDRHVITYEEFMDESGCNPTSIKNLLKINNTDKEISLSKRGAVYTDMVFKKDFIHNGLYKTSFGTLKMDIITSELTIDEEADAINATIKYGLEFNCQHVSNCSITISISNIY